MIHNYIYGANAVLLTYDITNYESFQNLEARAGARQGGARGILRHSACGVAFGFRVRCDTRDCHPAGPRAAPTPGGARPRLGRPLADAAHRSDARRASLARSLSLVEHTRKKSRASQTRVV